MKKIRNALFMFFILFSLIAFTGCSLRENQTPTEPEYTVTFINTNGNVITKITNYVGVELRSYQIPEVPEVVGKDGKWVDAEGNDADFTAINEDTIIFAYYELEKYVVTFYDELGVAYPDTADWSNKQVVEYGSAATAPVVVIEGYTTSWDVAYDNITGDLDVHLVKTINKYNVQYVNWDGSKLDEAVVEYNSNATTSVVPTKSANAEFTYTFAGWDADGDGVVDAEPHVVKGDMTITAVFTATVNKYEVVFENYDGSVVDTQEVEYGKVPTAPANPAKPATQQYTYTFAGWDVNGDGSVDALPVVHEKVVAKAVYTSTVNKYTVTFKAIDGSVLSTQDVEYGSAATAPAAPAVVGHTFDAWNTSFDNIVDDLEVIAVYKINNYQYTFYDEDGTTIISQGTTNYQGPITVPANPTKPSTVQYDYVFAGWDKPVPSAMPAEDLTFVATYTPVLREYTVTFYAEDGVTVLQSSDVTYGTNAAQPTAPAKTGHSFAGWLVNGATTPVSVITVEGVVEAVASYSINTYVVVGRVPLEGLGAQDSAYIEKEITRGYYGQTGINIEEAIANISWDREGYNLVGWKLSDGTDIALSELHNFTIPAENTFLYPQYEIKTFEVKFFDWDGTQIGTTQVVNWGEDAVAPANPTRSETVEYTYTFLFWSHSYEDVKADVNTTAVYASTKQQYTVTFLDDLGNVIGTSTVDYGTAATEPASMKETYIGKTWTWDGSFDNVVADITVKATFVAKVYKITIYIGEMYYTFERLYGEVFNVVDEVPLGSGSTIKLTGNLVVKEASGALTQTTYVGQYVVEDVDSVSFNAEYVVK